MKEGGIVKEYMRRVNELVEQLVVIGVDINNKYLIYYLLCGLFVNWDPLMIIS